jgi:anaerobic glycerol-3-phosphate dehydrogenase
MAGIALAKQGREVIIVGRGTTSTALSTGRLWLGPELRGDRSLVTAIKEVGEHLRWFDARPGPLIAVTNNGTLARQDLSSAHDWVLDPGRPTAVVGVRGNQDLDPDLACRSLAEAGTGAACQAYWLDLPALRSDPGSPDSPRDGGPMDELASCLGGLKEEAVVLPPLFGGLDQVDLMDRLARASGREIFEPMTPLSLPGLRLQSGLERAAREAGCLLWKDVLVGDVQVRDGRGSRATLLSGMRELAVQPGAFVLATGNLVGCGLGLGLLAALALTRFLAHLLYGVRAGDLATTCTSALALACVALAAAFVPCRRAIRVDPSTALRHT